ncbi:hypothetical protein Tco_1319670 [Tanacetum coccineum]
MTPESVQAMIDQALLRNSTNGDGSHRNEGVVGLTRWIEKMESVFNISGCAIENQVKFATCTLLGAALTWWNGQIRSLGPDAHSMTWEKVDKYIIGLPDNIYGNVKSARPKTLDEAIELANDLMDQKLHTYAERQSDNKRKADDSSRNNHGHQQQPFKAERFAKVYNIGTGEKKPTSSKRELPKLKNKMENGMHKARCNAIGNAEKRSECIENPDSMSSRVRFLLNTAIIHLILTRVPKELLESRNSRSGGSR